MKGNENFEDFFKEDPMPESERSLNSSDKSGWPKFDFDDNKQFCDMMLPKKRGESVDGRLGLDILERCWERLKKADAVRGNVLRHLLRKVSSPEEVQRLKRWRKRMQTETAPKVSKVSSPEDVIVQRLKGWQKRMKTESPPVSRDKGENGNEGTISETEVDQQWAWDTLDAVEATVDALKDCRSMIHQTFKKVFK